MTTIPEFKASRYLFGCFFATLCTNKNWCGGEGKWVDRVVRDICTVSPTIHRDSVRVSASHLYRLAQYIIAHTPTLFEGDETAVMSDISQHACIEFFEEVE